MAITNEFDHAPAADLDYGFTWASWLETGETIVTSDWAVTPSGMTLSNEAVDGAITSVFASAGTVNVVYYLTNTITTSAVPPRTDSRTVILSCKKR
jgi:hypothetical protein